MTDQATPQVPAALPLEAQVEILSTRLEAVARQRNEGMDREAVLTAANMTLMARISALEAKLAATMHEAQVAASSGARQRPVGLRKA